VDVLDEVALIGGAASIELVVADFSPVPVTEHASQSYDHLPNRIQAGVRASHDQGEAGIPEPWEHGAALHATPKRRLIAAWAASCCARSSRVLITETLQAVCA
jgi:hypothetical protein